MKLIDKKISLKEFNTTIHYLNNENDTVPLDFIISIFKQIRLNINKYIPDFFHKYEIEIWNHDIKECPVIKEGFYVDNKHKKIIITTQIFDNHYLDDEICNWNYILGKACAYIYLFHINFCKNKYILNKWRDLRSGYNNLDYTETIIDDFIYLFCYQYSSIKKSQSTIMPDKIMGLKSLYLIWYFLLKIFNKTWKIIFYKKFVSRPHANYIGFVYGEYDFKAKTWNWNKLTTQGLFTYSDFTDEWELVTGF